jgi:predicted regulator of Ras-like GTPase activity (Roadblock/LC7/MglB family)
MDIIDRIPGIIGYATVRADDGAVDETKGSSATALADLTAYFSSAGEVITNNLELGELKYVSLQYGSNRLVIVRHGDKFIGFEIERDKDPLEIIRQLEAPVAVEQPPIVVPRSLSLKIHQINLLIDEFGGETEREHWFDLLNQSLGLLGREIAPVIGVVENHLAFKANPPAEKEDEYNGALRYIVDFLVKKAVEEMGSSQARAKVQTVIERMR